MATDLERLVVTLDASLTKYERAMQKALGQTNATAKRIETRFNRMNSVVSSQFARLGGFFLSGIALRGAQQLIDASTRIENSLRIAGLEGDELTKVYNRLFESAQKNAAPIESLAELYGRAALVQKELNISTEELLGFTDKVAVALRVSGKSAQESSGALLQLSQALGSGVVRAEEFNSILEGALPIAQAAAAGLDEAGGSVAKLRTLVIDGKVSSEAFFRAFEAGATVLEDKVAGAQFTVAQSFTTLNNALIDAAGQFDETTGFTSALVDEIQSLSAVIAKLGAGFENLAGPLQTVGGFIDTVRDKFKQLREAIGVESFFEGTSLLEGRIGFARGPSAATGAAAASGLQGFTPKATPKTVSLADFAPPTSAKDSKERESAFARENRQLRERTDALIAQQVALTQVNPLIDDYGFAIERAKAEQELLAAAQKEGLEITPELRASIGQLAEGYAAASAELARMTEEQDKARERFEEFRDLGRDVIGGFINDIRSGTSAVESLGNALSRVADKLIDIGLNNLFGLFGGGSSGGSGIPIPRANPFGFADGGFTGNGGKNTPAGIVHGGEFVFSKAAVDRAGAGSLDALHRRLRGYAEGGFVGPSIPRIAGGGSGVQINYAPTVNAPNADDGTVAQIRDVLARDRREFESRVVSIVRSMPNRRLDR